MRDGSCYVLSRHRTPARESLPRPCSVTKSDDIRCRGVFFMLARDLFDHNDLQAILNLENRAALMHKRPAPWPGILSKLRRVHNNDDLRSIVRELHSNTSE